MPSDIKKYNISRYSELGFWSQTGLHLALGMIATLCGHYARADATPVRRNHDATCCPFRMNVTEKHFTQTETETHSLLRPERPHDHQ
jgi:hypothetical protein